eukprot:jgi/Mesvir1/4834/Mv11116-RA.4
MRLAQMPPVPSANTFSNANETFSDWTPWLLRFIYARKYFTVYASIGSDRSLSGSPDGSDSIPGRVASLPTAQPGVPSSASFTSGVNSVADAGLKTSARGIDCLGATSSGVVAADGPSLPLASMPRYDLCLKSVLAAPGVARDRWTFSEVLRSTQAAPGFVVVLLANRGQGDFLQNWACSARAVGVTRFIVFVPGDPGYAAELQQLGFTVATDEAFFPLPMDHDAAGRNARTPESEQGRAQDAQALLQGQAQAGWQAPGQGQEGALRRTHIFTGQPEQTHAKPGIAAGLGQGGFGSQPVTSEQGRAASQSRRRMQQVGHQRRMVPGMSGMQQRHGGPPFPQQAVSGMGPGLRLFSARAVMRQQQLRDMGSSHPPWSQGATGFPQVAQEAQEGDASIQVGGVAVGRPEALGGLGHVGGRRRDDRQVFKTSTAPAEPAAAPADPGAVLMAARAGVGSIGGGSANAPPIPRSVVDFGSVDYQVLMLMRTAIVMEVLALGYDMIIADIDAVWLQNPIPHVLARARHEGLDVLGQSDITTICGGFVYLRGSGVVARAMWATILWRHAKVVRDARQRGHLVHRQAHEQFILAALLQTKETVVEPRDQSVGLGAHALLFAGIYPNHAENVRYKDGMADPWGYVNPAEACEGKPCDVVNNLLSGFVNENTTLTVGALVRARKGRPPPPPLPVEDWSHEQPRREEYLPRYKLLELTRFPDGKHYFEGLLPTYTDVMVVHNNWIVGKANKLKRFRAGPKPPKGTSANNNPPLWLIDDFDQACLVLKC